MSQPQTNGASDRRIVVSVHDIAPSTAPDVRWLLAQLDAIGIRRRVLKVIPNEAGVGDIRADLDLVNLLRDEAAAGSEVVLHGYTHRSAGPPRGAPLLRLGVRLFAPKDSEFATLRHRESVRRLAVGRDVLGGLDLAPVGFCPPAWMAPKSLDADLLAAGFRYIVRVAAITEVAADRRRWIPAVGYMGAPAGVERMTRFDNSVIPRSPFGIDTLRVFLHPQRAQESAHCAAVLRALPHWAEGRRAITYAEMLDEDGAARDARAGATALATSARVPLPTDGPMSSGR